MGATVRKTERLKWLAGFLVAAAVIVCCLLAFNAARASSAEQGAVSLRQSILAAANQCAAVEGSYPLSLSHLEDCYGISVNDDVYAVTYEAFATNMPPNVVVKLK